MALVMSNSFLLHHRAITSTLNPVLKLEHTYDHLTDANILSCHVIFIQKPLWFGLQRWYFTATIYIITITCPLLFMKMEAPYNFQLKVGGAVSQITISCSTSENNRLCHFHWNFCQQTLFIDYVLPILTHWLLLMYPLLVFGHLIYCMHFTTTAKHSK